MAWYWAFVGDSEWDETEHGVVPQPFFTEDGKDYSEWFRNKLTSASRGGGGDSGAGGSGAGGSGAGGSGAGGSGAGGSGAGGSSAGGAGGRGASGAGGSGIASSPGSDRATRQLRSGLAMG
jgi:hypothetical protein